MLTLRIDGYTDVLGPPPGWDEAKRGKCGSLAVRIVRDASGRGVCCESAWEVTPGEIEMLRRGGYIVLRVHGNQVPVALSVEMPP